MADSDNNQGWQKHKIKRAIEEVKRLECFNNPRHRLYKNQNIQQGVNLVKDDGSRGSIHDPNHEVSHIISVVEDNQRRDPIVKVGFKKMSSGRQLNAREYRYSEVRDKLKGHLCEFYETNLVFYHKDHSRY